MSPRCAVGDLHTCTASTVVHGVYDVASKGNVIGGIADRGIAGETNAPTVYHPSSGEIIGAIHDVPYRRPAASVSVGNRA